MSREIIKADPIFKRKILGFLIVFAIPAIFILHYLINHIRSMSSGMELVAAAQNILLLLWILLAIPFVLGAYLISIATKSLIQGQYPPNDIKVLRDTFVLRGKEAKGRAIALLIVASSLMIACAGAGYYSYKVLSYLVFGS